MSGGEKRCTNITCDTKLALKDAIGDLPIEYDPSVQHIGTKQ